MTGADVDYQMGITTSQSRPCDDDPTAFQDCEDSMGNTGRLRGLGNTGNETGSAPTLLVPGDPSLESSFQALVDVGINGATEEYGLWIVAEAACASLELPYDSDFDASEGDTLLECSGSSWDTADPWADFCRCYPGEYHGYNVATDGTRFLRQNTDLLVIVVSDEGDFTPNMGSNAWPWDISDCQIGPPWPVEVQDLCAADPSVTCGNFCKIDRFVEFFGALNRRVVFAVVGPGASLDTTNLTAEVTCNDQNSSVTMLEFYLWAAELTGGAYIQIDEHDGAECVDADFEAAMRQIAQLLIEVAGGG